MLEEPKSDADAYAAAYRQHANTLRGWLVAYGIGGPALFLSNDKLRETLGMTMINNEPTDVQGRDPFGRFAMLRELERRAKWAKATWEKLEWAQLGLPFPEVPYPRLVATELLKNIERVACPFISCPTSTYPSQDNRVILTVADG